MRFIFIYKFCSTLRANKLKIHLISLEYLIYRYKGNINNILLIFLLLLRQISHFIKYKFCLKYDQVTRMILTYCYVILKTESINNIAIEIFVKLYSYYISLFV